MKDILSLRKRNTNELLIKQARNSKIKYKSGIRIEGFTEGIDFNVRDGIVEFKDIFPDKSIIRIGGFVSL